MTFDPDGGPYEPVDESVCREGYVRKPDEVHHITASDVDGNVQSHIVQWGGADEGIWIRVSDSDMVDLNTML